MNSTSHTVRATADWRRKARKRRIHRSMKGYIDAHLAEVMAGQARLKGPGTLIAEAFVEAFCKEYMDRRFKELLQ